VINHDLQLEPGTSTAKPVAGGTLPNRLKRLERARPRPRTTPSASAAAALTCQQREAILTLKT